MEMIELLMIVSVSSVLILISYFLFFTKMPEVTKITAEGRQFERVGDVARNIFYTRIPSIDKNLAQLIGDMVVNDREVVDYGDRYGGVNVTKLIYDNFNSYFENRWHLKMSYESQFEFGYEVPSDLRIRTFIIELPLPSYRGEVIDAEFAQW